MKLASKSKKRLEILEALTEGITHPEIFEVIDYKKQSEDKIKQFMYPHIVDVMTEYIMKHKSVSRSMAKLQVKEMLKWEGNVNTTVHNIVFMGTQNRPDMVFEIADLKVAIEIKRGGSGSDLRAGIGQSIIYSTHYDFVITLFIDTSADKRVHNARRGSNEINFTEELWKNYNIKFITV
tara:strand:- start:396 stop:932 length:537 start_codon:yes stop_codon:yes gene_type:complete